MKKHLSVFMLMARGTIYKVLGLLFVTAAVELAIFYKRADPALYTLDQVFNTDSVPLFALFASVLVLTVILCLNGCQSGSQQSYTLQRLSIPERNICLMQGLYNTVCYFVLWGVQLLIALVVCGYYMSQTDPAASSNQAVFLAAYSDGFFHALLPLQDWPLYFYNVVLAISLGFTSAALPFWRRHGKAGFWPVFLVLVSCSLVQKQLGQLNFNVILSLIVLGIASLSALLVWRGSEYEDA